MTTIEPFAYELFLSLGNATIQLPTFLGKDARIGQVHISVTATGSCKRSCVSDEGMVSVRQSVSHQWESRLTIHQEVLKNLWFCNWWHDLPHYAGARNLATLIVTNSLNLPARTVKTNQIPTYSFRFVWGCTFYQLQGEWFLSCFLCRLGMERCLGTLTNAA